MANEIWQDSPFGENSIFHPSFQKMQHQEIELRKIEIEKNIEVLQIEGPFNSQNELVRFVSRNHSYYYLATANQKLTVDNSKYIKWAISYDEDKIDKSYYLSRGGKLFKGKLKVDLQISKGDNKYKLFAYNNTNIPKNSGYVEAIYKKVIAFFIGGAGDKKSYAGSGPTNLILDEVMTPFKLIAPTFDYKAVYLGYNEVYGNAAISKNVISEIPNIEGTDIYIIGHSLGGWNAAHLITILQKLKYKVETLITLDPVGTKVGVTVISDIYYDYPNPQCRIWLNTFTDPKTYDTDDLIADVGGQWSPKDGFLRSIKNIHHHREVGAMFNDIIFLNLSSSGILLSNIKRYLEKE